MSTPRGRPAKRRPVREDPEGAIATLERDPAETEDNEIGREPVAETAPEEAPQTSAQRFPNQIQPDPKDRQDDGELARAMRKTELYTRLRLDREPKVLVRVPRILTKMQSRRIAESAVPVLINGVRYNVPRGVTVPVPESVARLLERAGYLDGSEASLDIGPAPQVVMDWPGGSH
jgi:hypothetical protein